MSFGDKNFTYGPRIVKDGLVFYMDAANPKSYVSGNTTCNDLISNGGGTLENGTGFSTENNGSWSFDGSDDHIVIGSALDVLSNTITGTFDIWLKLHDATPVTLEVPFAFGNSSNFNIISIRTEIDGRVGAQCGLTTGPKWYITTTSFNFSVNTWTNVVLVQDGVTPSIYVNGILQTNSFTGSDATAWFNAIPLNNGMIGARYIVSRQSYFDGDISNVKLYNRNMSAEEIIKNFNSVKGRFPGVKIGITYEDESIAFFERVYAQGGSLLVKERDAINDYVIAAKSGSWWDDLIADYPMVGGTSSSCSVNLKTPGTFDITWNAVFASDFTDTGWTPDGTDAYGNTGLNALSHLQHQDTHLSYYSRDNTAAETIEIGANTGGVTLHTRLSTRVSNGTSVGVFYRSTAGNFESATNSPGAGLIMTQVSGSSLEIYKNGVALSPVEDGAGGSTAPSRDLYVGALNANNTASGFSTKECAGISIGNSLTSAQALSMYNARQAMNTALNREV